MKTEIGELRIIRVHEHWCIVQTLWVLTLGDIRLSNPLRSIVKNIEGPYEDALAEFFRFSHNFQKIKKALS